MKPCHPGGHAERRRIVLTGGPGAGKTAALELVRHAFCEHVCILPESASILFGGGFPRGSSGGELRAAQRAIYRVQRELESWAEARPAAVILCDRGTVDGAAYWPGPGELWDEVGSRRETELARYDVVIHLRTPPAHNGYNHQNPLRRESAEEAALIDQRIEEAWRGHPRVFQVESRGEFFAKAHDALLILNAELPPCCRRPLPPLAK